MKRLLLLLIPITANAGPFAEVSLSVREQHTLPPIQFYYDRDHNHVYYTDYSPYDVQTKNPYGAIKVGYSWKLSTSLSAALSLEHESSVSTSKDKGLNSVRVSLRWGDL